MSEKAAALCFLLMVAFTIGSLVGYALKALFPGYVEGQDYQCPTCGKVDCTEELEGTELARTSLEAALADQGEAFEELQHCFLQEVDKTVELGKQIESEREQNAYDRLARFKFQAEVNEKIVAEFKAIRDELEATELARLACEHELGKRLELILYAGEVCQSLHDRLDEALAARADDDDESPRHPAKLYVLRGDEWHFAGNVESFAVNPARPFQPPETITFTVTPLTFQ